MIDLNELATAVRIICERKWGAARGVVMEDYPEIAAIIDATIDAKDKQIAELTRKAEMADRLAEALRKVFETGSFYDVGELLTEWDAMKAMKEKC